MQKALRAKNAKNAKNRAKRENSKTRVLHRRYRMVDNVR
jgi:hypothetical protein